MMRVFISYAQDDVIFRDALTTHIEVLCSAGIISSWHDGNIAPGEDWKAAIDRELSAADVVVLLVSASFLASKSCQEFELGPALERWKERKVLVMPVIVRACDWGASSIAHLAVLPERGKPIGTWLHQDDAWAEITRALRIVARGRASITTQASGGQSNNISMDAAESEGGQTRIAASQDGNPSDKAYVLAGVRWGYTRSGRTELTGEKRLLDALTRTRQPDEVIYPSLSYAYHDDHRLTSGHPPNIASVVFLNLGLPGADIPDEIQMVRAHLPCSVFVLYASDEEFRRCMSELPETWTRRFQHYYLLNKAESLTFDTSVRQILDEAKRLALRKKTIPRFHTAFISYCHNDKSFATWLADNLQSYGIRCWLDEKELRAGDRIHAKIAEAIRKQDKLLLCASKSSLTSWWVEHEINAAIAKERQAWTQTGKEQLSLIPLNLDGYLFSGEWTSGWREQLNSRLAPDFTDWRAMVEISSASGFEERQAAIAQHGLDVLRSAENALLSIRRALHIDHQNPSETLYDTDPT